MKTLVLKRSILVFGAVIELLLAPISEAQVPSPAPTSTTSPAPESSPGRRRLRDKEAEGSKAPNRFEADTVLKSQYTLDGQPLEVDPD